MSSHGKRAILALAAGLVTFLALAMGKQDVGDEFIYGLVVGAIVWAFSRSAFEAPPRKES